MFKKCKNYLINKLGVEEGYSIAILLMYYYFHLIGKTKGYYNRITSFIRSIM